MSKMTKDFFWLWLLTPVVIVPIVYANGKKVDLEGSVWWFTMGALFLWQWLNDRSERRRNSSS